MLLYHFSNILRYTTGCHKKTGHIFLQTAIIKFYTHTHTHTHTQQHFHQHSKQHGLNPKNVKKTYKHLNIIHVQKYSCYGIVRLCSMLCRGWKTMTESNVWKIVKRSLLNTSDTERKGNNPLQPVNISNQQSTQVLSGRPLEDQLNLEWPLEQLGLSLRLTVIFHVDLS